MATEIMINVAPEETRVAVLDRKIRQCRVEQPPPSDADRTEGDELVRAVRRLGHSLQSTEDVVADARPRMRERRDVIDNPHGAE